MQASQRIHERIHESFHESYRGLARVWDITVYFAPGPDYNPAGNVVAQAAQAEFNLFMPLIDGSSRS